MSKKTKVITSNIQPNPKEAEIWAKINEDGSREVKQYNSSTGKFECCGGSGSGSGNDSMVYYDVRGNMDVLHGTYNILSYVSMVFIKPYNTSLGTFEKIIPAGFISFNELLYDMSVNEYVLGVALDKNTVIYHDGNYFDVVTTFEQAVEDKSLIKHLTKEQFYNLEA